jgi:hypothetical protein
MCAVFLIYQSSMFILPPAVWLKFQLHVPAYDWLAALKSAETELIRCKGSTEGTHTAVLQQNMLQMLHW